MTELIKVSIWSRKSKAHVAEMKANKVFMNCAFGNLSFSDECWDGCKFVNCVFRKVAPYNDYAERQRLVFENCTFLDKNAFMRGQLSFCKFIRCKFDDCWIKTGFDNCEFVNCKLDHCYIAGIHFNKCSFKQCESTSGSYSSVTCVNCEGKDFISILSPMVCPETGEYEAWKKCFHIENSREVYAKLLIPADAIRFGSFRDYCRASKAKVLGFYDKNGKPLPLNKARSYWDKSFVYTVGKTVEPTSPFDLERYHEDTSGIHHFMTLKEAVEWRHWIPSVITPWDSWKD